MITTNVIIAATIPSGGIINNFNGLLILFSIKLLLTQLENNVFDIINNITGRSIDTADITFIFKFILEYTN
jgi:hypothetical protein